MHKKTIYFLANPDSIYSLKKPFIPKKKTNKTVNRLKQEETHE